MIRTEEELISLAEAHPDDVVANKAMRELRERFDETYMFCADCDGLVCKEKDCCWNSLDDIDPDSPSVFYGSNPQ